MDTGITFTFAAIFLGAAVLSSVALYARQPIIIAYIAVGMALGPHGFGLVTDMALVSGAGHVGIILLLFLLGLDMKPIALWNSLRQSTLVAVLSAVIFAATGYGLSRLFGFAGMDAVLISAALFVGLMFAAGWLLSGLSVFGIGWIDSAVSFLGGGAAFIIGLFLFPAFTGIIISFML